MKTECLFWEKFELENLINYCKTSIGCICCWVSERWRVSHTHTHRRAAVERRVVLRAQQTFGQIKVTVKHVCLPNLWEHLWTRSSALSQVLPIFIAWAETAQEFLITADKRFRRRLIRNVRNTWTHSQSGAVPSPTMLCDCEVWQRQRGFLFNLFIRRRESESV